MEMEATKAMKACIDRREGKGKTSEGCLQWHAHFDVGAAASEHFFTQNDGRRSTFYTTMPRMTGRDRIRKHEIRKSRETVSQG